jgi:hypothetical protein
MSHLVKLIQLGAQNKEYEKCCVAHLTVQRLSRLIQLIRIGPTISNIKNMYN